MDGDSRTPSSSPPPKVFACPNCAAQVGIYAQGQSITAACRSCGAVIDVANDNFRIISTAHQKFKVSPVIELGTKGQLHGATWQVIGFMQRADGTTDVYSWREYLLFNPTKGFRWLTEFDGHWNFVTTVKSLPTGDSESKHVTHMNAGFDLFHKGTARVTYVLGEFYWRVAVGDKVQVRDFINPPHMLSCEIDPQEKIWSFSAYVEPEDIQKAFKVTKMPMRMGVAPNQPSTLKNKYSEVKFSVAMFVLAFVVIQFVTIAFAPGKVVFDESYQFVSSDPNQKTRVTPAFELGGLMKNVQVDLYSKVDNTWLGVDIELVNEETGDSINFEQGVEYYHGYDSDGSWSEGGTHSREILSSIPSGKYHMVLEPSSGSSSEPYRVVVRRGVVKWSNFFWGMVFLGIYPVWVWWRNRTFEASRWSTSDFSSYWNMEDVLDQLGDD